MGLDKENEIQRNDQGMRLLRPKVTKLVKEGQSDVGSPRLLLRDALRQGGEARAGLFKSWSPREDGCHLGLCAGGTHTEKGLVLFAG